MPAFDTLDKKPKVWNIAVLTAVTAVLMAILLSFETISLRAVEGLICLYLLLTVFFLIRAFVRQLRYNPYSYNTIYYSGFALFACFMLVSQIVIMVRTWPAREAGTEDLLYLLYVFLSSARRYMAVTMPFITLFSIALCVSNIALIRHEGKRLVNVLGIILSILLIGGELLLYWSTRVTAEEWEVHVLHNFLTNLFAAFYLYFECMLIGTILANAVILRYKPAFDKDFIIILGCGMRKDGTPTPLLDGRIGIAEDFGGKQERETGKKPVYVASGGKGPDEVISEASCIAARLAQKGVPAERILLEDRSGSTYENMLFSRKVIGDVRNKKILFATTNYHVFRSGLMARRVGMRAVGIGARTKWYFWPNATVREFVGILTEHRVKQALILGGMVVLYGGMTLLYYL
ncbi:MAG: YdcF family protein [Lachnospiraceae bacterium]|nr:YdcF family protein [Lachnospiraceae bacterium]